MRVENEKFYLEELARAMQDACPRTWELRMYEGSRELEGRTPTKGIRKEI